MEISSQFLLTIGGIFLLGLFTSTIAHRTFLPRATLLLLFGVLIGQEALDIIPHSIVELFDIVAQMTLLMVGFLLGGKLVFTSLHDSARQVLWISIAAALVTSLVVGFALALVGLPLELSIILGCIASATAPAAVFDVVKEAKTDSRFSKLLLSIVALDDIWALMLFAIGLAIVKTITLGNGDTEMLMFALRDIGGAILLGTVIGIPAAYATGRINKGQPILTEALGIVFVCGGLAMWLDVSYLVAVMVMGAVIANLARHHDYPFSAIEDIESNFMIVFFVLAGASLELSALNGIGLAGIVYIIFRALGKFLGARLGCHISKTKQQTQRWMGAALLPQAGVSIGMALVASTHFPQYRSELLTLVIASTVFFEIVGPVFTRLAIQHNTND